MDISGITTYTYDSNGNLTEIWPQVGNRTTMAYDKENRLSVHKAGTSVNTMTYDGDGLKRAEIASATRTTLVWDGADYLQTRSGPMPVVNYHTVNGRIIGETTGSTRTDTMTDALGSVTGTVNASQVVVNTYRYKPYGELLAKTGTADDPAFMWNGTTQSRRTGLGFADQYNRARHYGTRQGQWTSVDPLWPRERAYTYAKTSPASRIDMLGLRPMLVQNYCASNVLTYLPLKKVWETGGCGFYRLCTQWRLLGRVKERAVIVQCISRESSLAACPNCPPETLCDGGSNRQFCEYWEVLPPGEVCSGDCATDQFRGTNLAPLSSVDFFAFEQNATNCKGKHLVTGVAKLILWSELPPGWDSVFKRSAGSLSSLPEFPPSGASGDRPSWFDKGTPLSISFKQVSCDIDCCGSKLSFNCRHGWFSL